MPDREKVIKGIDICLQRFHCGEDCPYYELECMEQLREDVLALLKEQNPWSDFTEEDRELIDLIEKKLDIRIPTKEEIQEWVQLSM